jgi:purine-nucleoside phosphorylase
LAAALGARWILLTNAAGSLDPRLTPGTLMVAQDHIRIFLGPRAVGNREQGPPLRGSIYHADRVGSLFRHLGGEGLPVVRGVLAGCLGPSYETAAEVEMMRRLGASAACMSTVLEAEEAARQGMEVAALSLLTNLATGLASRPLTHQEVVDTARQLAPALARGLAELLERWSGSDRPD